jgi:hypothetical protein
MKQFAVGQKWVSEDAGYGSVNAEVIETSNQGRRGTVVITDDQGNVLDIFSRTAPSFQASGEWQLIEE